jgi:hypothetical protein
MSAVKYVMATAVLAVLAAFVFSAEKAADDKSAASVKQPPAAKDAAPGKPAAASDAKAAAEARYAKITSKNIFYPRRQAAADAGEAGSNPQGAGLVLTGVVSARGETYAVIQNTGTGEASIVTVGEATGGGELIAATMEGITLSTESGTFKVPVGNYLSGAKAPDLPAMVKAPEAPPAGGPPAAAAEQGTPATGTQVTPTGPQPPSGQGDPNADGGGRPSRGGRGRMSQEQIDAFRNMTPEQRDQMRQQFRQRRGRRSDNTGENQ